jgi:hypothetical protein
VAVHASRPLLPCGACCRLRPGSLAGPVAITDLELPRSVLFHRSAITMKRPSRSGLGSTNVPAATQSGARQGRKGRASHAPLSSGRDWQACCAPPDWQASAGRGGRRARHPPPQTLRVEEPAAGLFVCHAGVSD